LRALGVLVAVFQGVPDQSVTDAGHLPSLVGIEEPEAAVHPAAAAVLRDALRDAATRRQIVVTSHSPDLLDDPTVPLGGSTTGGSAISPFFKDPSRVEPVERILAVGWNGGSTNVGELDDAGKMALRESLYTPGELLRINQLLPSGRSDAPLRLFEL
jgi:hypothetical protein